MALDAIRSRGLDRWLGAYARQALTRRAPRPSEPIRLILGIADHYEPLWNGASRAVADERVRRWVEDYPRALGGFRDADGRPPRHTFFYPIDEYVPEHVDALAGLCRAGFGEVEIHHHHDRDTSAALRARLLEFKSLFAERHGLLPRHKATGALAFGFVHGNWALDNALPGGHWCGVDDELTVLREAGCYADFTLPAAPSPAQTRKINSIYYAIDDPSRPRSHDTGVDVGAAPAPPGALMLIQGPLLLDWGRRKWGLVPRVENACLQASQPPTAARLENWLRARVQVPTRPDWFFVKLHTHGAHDAGRQVLLGAPMARFHEYLARRADADANFSYHYVTAREMYNIARAAEAGWQGTVDAARDFELIWDGQAGLPAAAGAAGAAGASARG